MCWGMFGNDSRFCLLFRKTLPTGSKTSFPDRILPTENMRLSLMDMGFQIREVTYTYPPQESPEVSALLTLVLIALGIPGYFGRSADNAPVIKRANERTG